MGAMVVYEYLKAFGSDSVAGIMIVDQPPSDYAWEGYPFGVLTVEALAEMVEGLQLDQRAVAEEFAGLMQHEPRADVSAWMVEEITRVPAAVASTILVNQTLRDYRSFLPEISCPTLVAFGRDPKLTPPEAGEYIASMIPDARFEVFEHSSHVPFLEETDRFNALVEEFSTALS
jgi:pimeloyl-ACP methyl ester carboxylesterase